MAPGISVSNYHRLNYITDTYLPPHIDNDLGLCSSYWQVELTPEEHPKTTSSVSKGLWPF